MKQEYIITFKELQERGLDLNDYALDENKSLVIIYIGLDKIVTEILKLNDNFKYEEDIEKALDEEPKLIQPFKKLQFRVIYNLIILGDNDPLDKEVDDIICCDLRWGEINGFQKRIFGVRG